MGTLLMEIKIMMELILHHLWMELHIPYMQLDFLDLLELMEVSIGAFKDKLNVTYFRCYPSHWSELYHGHQREWE